jgi:1,2-dihydroxy-3-keto-5-methylthiopentene dioxygenase
MLVIPDRRQQLTNPKDVAHELAAIGIVYEQWHSSSSASADASADDILAAYDADIQRMKVQGGYVTADVIDIHPHTPNIDALLAKFDKEHTHDDDEVRFTVEGKGIFSINPETAPVVHVLVEAGDLLVVPKNVRHWFNLTKEKRIRTIRLFTDMSGWTPHYRNSQLEQQYPVQDWQEV